MNFLDVPLACQYKLSSTSTYCRTLAKNCPRKFFNARFEEYSGNKCGFMVQEESGWRSYDVPWANLEFLLRDAVLLSVSISEGKLPDINLRAQYLTMVGSETRPAKLMEIFKRYKEANRKYEGVMLWGLPAEENLMAWLNENANRVTAGLLSLPHSKYTVLKMPKLYLQLQHDAEIQTYLGIVIDEWTRNEREIEDVYIGNIPIRPDLKFFEKHTNFISGGGKGEVRFGSVDGKVLRLKLETDERGSFITMDMFGGA
ncbi:unnamed protein product, partial [Mesorhabditis spiculigera]